MPINEFLKHIIHLFDNRWLEQFLDEFDQRVASMGGYNAAESNEKRALLRLLPLKWEALTLIKNSSERLNDMRAFVSHNEYAIDLYYQQVSVMQSRNLLRYLEDLIGVSSCRNRAILCQKIRLSFQTDKLSDTMQLIYNFENGDLEADYEKQISLYIRQAENHLHVNESHLQSAKLHFLDNESICFVAHFTIDNFNVHLLLPFPLNDTAYIEGDVQVIDAAGNSECYPINGKEVIENHYYSPFCGLYNSQYLNISVNNVRAFSIAD